MSKLIRKISIGKDYKNEAMHYAVGQEVYGGHTICDIIEENKYIGIKNKKLSVPFKCNFSLFVLSAIGIFSFL